MYRAIDFDKDVRVEPFHGGAFVVAEPGDCTRYEFLIHSRYNYYHRGYEIRVARFSEFPAESWAGEVFVSVWDSGAAPSAIVQVEELPARANIHSRRTALALVNHLILKVPYEKNVLAHKWSPVEDT